MAAATRYATRYGTAFGSSYTLQLPWPLPPQGSFGRTAYSTAYGGYRNPSGQAPNPLPYDLAEAIAMRVEVLVAGGVLTWYGSGLAPNGTQLPYGAYLIPDQATRRLDAAGTKGVEGTYQLQIFAGGRSAAVALGDQLAAFLAAAWESGGLVFTRGHLFNWLDTEPTVARDPDEGPDGEVVWVDTRLFEFQISRP